MNAELIADGLAFPEGPIAMSDGSVLLVEIRRGTLTRISPSGDKAVVAEPGGGPNGAAIGPDGAIYICNNGARLTWSEHDGVVHPGLDPSPDYVGGSIQRVDVAKGDLVELYTHYRGQRLIAPNDLVFDSDGGFWFTDYGGKDGELLRYGSLYYARSDGSSLVRARRDLTTPNGVGLSPDGSTIYFAETFTGRLWAAEIIGPGKLGRAGFGPGKLLTTLPNFQVFDSLAVEENGNICVASIRPGAISIVSPQGVMEQVPCPDPVTTNICFGGLDRRDAFITASSTGKLYRVRWPRPGLRLNFN